MNREARTQNREARKQALALLLEAVELSKVPGTFSNFLMKNVFYKVQGMNAQQIEQEMLKGLAESTKVSPVAKKRFEDTIKSMTGNKNKLIRYLTDIVLKGDELGMQKGLLPGDRGASDESGMTREAASLTPFEKAVDEIMPLYEYALRGKAGLRGYDPGKTAYISNMSQIDAQNLAKKKFKQLSPADQKSLLTEMYGPKDSQALQRFFRHAKVEVEVVEAQAVPAADKPPRWAIGNPRLESAWKTVIQDYHPKNWPAAIAIFKNYCKKHNFPMPIAASEDLGMTREAQVGTMDADIKGYDTTPVDKPNTTAPSPEYPSYQKTMEERQARRKERKAQIPNQMSSATTLRKELWDKNWKRMWDEVDALRKETDKYRSVSSLRESFPNLDPTQFSKFLLRVNDACGYVANGVKDGRSRLKTAESTI